jgi:hypothetical protein
VANAACVYLKAVLVDIALVPGCRLSRVCEINNGIVSIASYDSSPVVVRESVAAPTSFDNFVTLLWLTSCYYYYC